MRTILTALMGVAAMHRCSTSNNRMSSGQFSIRAAVTNSHNEKLSLCSCLWQSAGMGQLKHLLMKKAIHQIYSKHFTFQ